MRQYPLGRCIPRLHFVCLPWVVVSAALMIEFFIPIEAATAEQAPTKKTLDRGADGTASACREQFDRFLANSEEASPQALREARAKQKSCVDRAMIAWLEKNRISHHEKSQPSVSMLESSQTEFVQSARRFAQEFEAVCEGSACRSCDPVLAANYFRLEQLERPSKHEPKLGLDGSTGKEVKALSSLPKVSTRLKRVFGPFLVKDCEWREPGSLIKCQEREINQLYQQLSVYFRSASEEGEVCAQLD